MKICVLNDSYFNFGDLSWDALGEFGEVSVYHTHSDDMEELKRRAQDADIIVGDQPMPRELIAVSPKLRYITLTATGFDGVDAVFARERGIPVSNVPGYGTASVSQFAIALLMELCSHTAYFDSRVRQGEWFGCFPECAGEHRLIELAGKTMGIIGFGRIGRAVGAAARALGMTVIAYNRSRCPEGEAIAEYVPLEELFARADVISLHCPANDATVGMINRSSIAKMKDGVIIINNGRGSLIRSADLAEALESGKVWAAGLDVAEHEPVAADDPLLRAPHCIITPHISWLPRESRRRIVDVTAENIRAFLAGAPQNVVN